MWARVDVQNLDADIDHLLTVVEHSAHDCRPHVVLIERADAADILIVARLEDGPLETRIGYRTIARPRARVLRVSFGGVIGAETDADRRLALDELRRPLREGEADLVVLPQLDTSGALWALASTTGSALMRDAAQARNAHWSVAVPESMDDFLAARSKNTRKSTKYYDRRMLRDHPETRVRLFCEEADLDELCDAMERVAATTYQRSIGAGYAGSPLERALMRLGMQRSWFRTWVLYFGETPVAFWQGFAYRGVYATGCPGFDPAYTQDRVGAYLAVRMIEQLCESDDVHTLDWGHGDADYKRNFGDRCLEEGEVHFYAATLRGARLRLVRGAAAAAVRLAKRVLASSGRIKRVKRAWRDRLASDRG